MNQRIKELVKAAKKYANDEAEYWHGGPSWEEMFETKFAELIVRECVGLVNLELQHNNPNDSLLALKIEEHFGVQE